MVFLPRVPDQRAAPGAAHDRCAKQKLLAHDAVRPPADTCSLPRSDMFPADVRSRRARGHPSRRSCLSLASRSSTARVWRGGRGCRLPRGESERSCCCPCIYCIPSTLYHFRELQRIAPLMHGSISQSRPNVIPSRCPRIWAPWPSSCSRRYGSHPAACDRRLMHKTFTAKSAQQISLETGPLLHRAL